MHAVPRRLIVIVGAASAALTLTAVGDDLLAGLSTRRLVQVGIRP